MKNRRHNGCCISLIKNLRTLYTKTPFAVFDDSGDPEIQNILARCGVDICFQKPFIFSEISIALKRVIYQAGKSNGSKLLQYADLTFDVANRAVRRQDKSIRLRNKEYALLELLLINQEKILPRDMIIDYVWDRNQRMLSNTIDVHIGLLRKKIDRGYKRKLIHTIHCVGYKFGEKP